MIIANMMDKKPSILWADVKILEDRLEAGFYKASDLEVLNRLLSSDQVKELGALCNLITDGTHQTPDYFDRGSGVPFLTSKNITDEGIDFNTDNDISFDQHHQLKKTVPKAGDILMTKIGSRIGVAKVFPSQSKDCNIFVSLALLRPNPDLIDPYYLEVFLNSSYGSIQAYRLAKGITQLDFHLGDIKKIQVLVPRVEIQKYIGNKVRKAEELREGARQLKDDINRMTNELLFMPRTKGIVEKSITIGTSFIDPERLDADYYSREHITARSVLNAYPTRKLKELAYITDGDHGTPVFKRDGVPFIRNKNVDEYIMDYSDLVFIDRGYEERFLKSSSLNKEDVLITKIGTIGRSAIYLDSEGNLNANTAIVRVYDKEIITPYFLCVLFNTNVYNIILNCEAGGAVQSALSLNRLGEVDVPIIGRAFQIKIESLLKNYILSITEYRRLINEAKKDVEDLIEGKFDESKISEGV